MDDEHLPGPYMRGPPPTPDLATRVDSVNRDKPSHSKGLVKADLRNDPF